ncbi:unnamed protein product [Prunus armeniaca]|uniref:Uncharacterized protein n=1 Tax=Prunus armeniaca TaxID=36596 RepID=A0A6J5X833_PRUAR|nr:unnamed protein product [Prunus armeniaca]
MLPLYSVSLHNKPPLSLHPFSLTNELIKTHISELPVPGNGVFKKKKSNPYYNSSSSSPSFIVYAAEKESQQFEVDPDKAREALKNLDQQLQSRSQRQARPPRQQAPDVSFARDQTEDEEVQEFSGSFFTITAVAVFAFTIFYNVFFYTVIKPSIDGPEQAPTTIAQREIPK